MLALRDRQAALLCGAEVGVETATELVVLLDGASGPGRPAEVVDLLIDCQSSVQLLARAAATFLTQDGVGKVV